MTRLYASLLFGLLIALSPLSLAQSVINVKSNFSVAETQSRLLKALDDAGMTVFTEVDHQKGAQSVELGLRPTRLVIFGNPKVGTRLMQCHQQIAIDLPQKALIYEDEQGDVWLAYNSPQFLAVKHGMQGCDGVLQKVAKALANFARQATQDGS